MSSRRSNLRPGLSQKYLIFFFDSPNWEKRAGISSFFRDVSQNTVYQRQKEENEKGAIYFLNHKRLPSVSGADSEKLWTPESSKYIKALPKMSIKEANEYLQFGGHLELFNKEFPHLKGVIEGSGVMNAESKVGVPDNMIEN